MKRLFVSLALAWLLAGHLAAADKTTTSAARQKYRIEYSQIPGDVTLVARIKPDYPKKLREAGIQGEVVVRFTVSGDGTVSEVSSLNQAHPALVQLAQNAVKRWRFVGTYSAPGSFTWVITSVTIRFRLLDEPAGKVD